MEPIGYHVSYNCADVVVESMYAAGLVSDGFEAKNMGMISTPRNLNRQLDIKYESQFEKPGLLEFYDKSVIKKFNYDIESYDVQNT